MAWTKDAFGQPMITAGGADYNCGANGFCSGMFTGNRVSKYFAQIGSSYYADQATTANMPTLWNSPIDGFPEIKWHQRLGTASTGKFLTAENGLTLTSGQNMALVWVQRACAETSPNNLSAFSYDSFWLGARPGGSGYWGLWGSVTEASWGSRNWFFAGGNVAHNAPHHPNLKYAVHAVVSSATGFSYFVDGVKTSFSMTPTSGNISGFLMGWGPSTECQTDNCALLGAALFNSALSDAQVRELTSSIHKRIYGAMPDVLLYVSGCVCDTTLDFDTTVTKDVRDQSWSYLLVNGVLPRAKRAKLTAVNMAVASSELGAVVGSQHVLLNNQAAKINAFLNSSEYINRTLVLGAPTNDIYYGDSAGNILSNMQTYQTSALSAGASACFVCTVIPRQYFTSGQNITKDALNASIRTTFGGSVIDLASLNWQPGGSSDWTTNYQDGVHPNAAGRALIANAVAPFITGYLYAQVLG